MTKVQAATIMVMAIGWSAAAFLCGSEGLFFGAAACVALGLAWSGVLMALALWQPKTVGQKGEWFETRAGGLRVNKTVVHGIACVEIEVLVGKGKINIELEPEEALLIGSWLSVLAKEQMRPGRHLRLVRKSG